MKSKKYLIFLFFLVLTVFLSTNFIFSSCKEEKTDNISTGTSNNKTSAEMEQTSPTLDQMIGEMIILGFRGTEIDNYSGIVEDINEYNIGGIILFDYDVPSKSFPRNILDPQQIKKLIEDLKKFTRSDLFIAVDQEGGYVNRLHADYGFIPIKSAQEMGEDDPENTFLEVSPLAMELDSLGFNLNFAPVIDV